MSVAAGLPSGRNALPSTSSSASYLPGPQLASTLRTVGSSTPSRSASTFKFAASDTIAPTADPRGAVDRRMTDRAGDPDRRDLVAFEERMHADDGVRLQQRDRARR